jgi:hypothetical protein
MKEEYKVKNTWKFKGANASYVSKHIFVKRRLVKPLSCQNCGKTTRLDLAFKNHDLGVKDSLLYTHDPDDYIWLCRKCHMTKDGRINNAIKYGFKSEQVKIFWKEKRYDTTKFHTPESDLKRSIGISKAHERGCYINANAGRSERSKEMWKNGKYQNIFTPEMSHKKSESLKKYHALNPYNEDTKKRISESNKLTKKLHPISEETRMRMKEASKKRWLDGQYANRKYGFTKDVKKQMSESQKKYHAYKKYENYMNA